MIMSINRKRTLRISESHMQSEVTFKTVTVYTENVIAEFKHNKFLTMNIIIMLISANVFMSS